MKIKISETGSLYIDGKAKTCPFDRYVNCGDDCALFTTEFVPADEFYCPKDEVIVDLCHHRHAIDPKDFTDERAKS